MRRFLILGLNFLVTSTSVAQVSSQLGDSNPLLGKSGTAGLPSIDSVGFNPAIAGELKRSSVQLIWGMESYQYNQRYPGFEAHSSSKTGLSPKLPIPRFIYKATPHFGIGGTIIPFAVSQPISVQDIPIVILSQQSLVDIEGLGKLNALADVSMGYAIHNTFSLGMRFNYVSYEGNGDLTESVGGTNIASFAVQSETMDLGIGLKFNMPQFSIGIMVSAFQSELVTSKFDTKLGVVKDDEESDGADDNGKSKTSGSLNTMRLGIGIRFHPRIYGAFDVEYEKAKKGEKRFSVVDMAEKELDSYDTLSFYSGMEFRVDSQSDVLVGYFNEPGSIGPGTKGEDGKAGFGFFDLALNLGEPPERPVWGMGAGIRYRLQPVRFKKKKRRFYRVILEAGVLYSETSIGIDEQGEQPGAYLAKRYKVPIKIIYRF